MTHEKEDSCHNERKGRNTMDDLRKHKLKKHEKTIQEWFDAARAAGMSEDQISVELARIFENVNSGKMRG